MHVHRCDVCMCADITYIWTCIFMCTYICAHICTSTSEFLLFRAFRCLNVSMILHEFPRISFFKRGGNQKPLSILPQKHISAAVVADVCPCGVRTCQWLFKNERNTHCGILRCGLCIACACVFTDIGYGEWGSHTWLLIEHTRNCLHKRTFNFLFFWQKLISKTNVWDICITYDPMRGFPTKKVQQKISVCIAQSYHSTH